MTDQDPEIGESTSSDEVTALTGTEAAAEQEFEGAYAPKKSVGRGALLFVVMMAAAGTLYFVFMRPAPNAAQGASSPAASAQATITAFLHDGKSNVEHMRKVLAGTHQLVEEFNKYPSAAQVPLVRLKSNPFEYGPGVVTTTRASAGEEARQAALKAAQGLELQTVILGESSRSCIINNKPYQEGQTVDMFTIEKILPNAVIVRSGIYRFELQIQR